MNRRALLADIFTALNMLCGFLAILVTIQKSFDRAVWLIFIAAIFDGLDGKVARKIHTDSTFGLQIDSLSDVVSFGIAPSVLVYEIHLHSLGIWGLIISFLPLLFSAIRLARHNAIGMTKPQKMYKGMPAPMATLTICSFIIVDRILPDLIANYRLLPLLVLFTSILMILKISYYKVPKLSFKEGTINTRNLIIFMGGLIFIPFFPEYIFFPLMLVYIVSGPLHWLTSRNGLKNNQANNNT